MKFLQKSFSSGVNNSNYVKNFDKAFGKIKVVGKCYECGGDIILLAKPNRTCKYMELNLCIPESFELPTCEQCGIEQLNEEYTNKLEEVLKEEYNRVKNTNA